MVDYKRVCPLEYHNEIDVQVEGGDVIPLRYLFPTKEGVIRIPNEQKHIHKMMQFSFLLYDKDGILLSASRDGFQVTTSPSILLSTSPIQFQAPNNQKDINEYFRSCIQYSGEVDVKFIGVGRNIVQKDELGDLRYYFWVWSVKFLGDHPGVGVKNEKLTPFDFNNINMLPGFDFAVIKKLYPDIISPYDEEQKGSGIFRVTNAKETFKIFSEEYTPFYLFCNFNPQHTPKPEKPWGSCSDCAKFENKRREARMYCIEHHQTFNVRSFSAHKTIDHGGQNFKLSECTTEVKQRIMSAVYVPSKKEDYQNNNKKRKTQQERNNPSPEEVYQEMCNLIAPGQSNQ